MKIENMYIFDTFFLLVRPRDTVMTSTQFSSSNECKGERERGGVSQKGAELCVLPHIYHVSMSELSKQVLHAEMKC